MRIACLCPTYGRPICAANALGLFVSQDYPQHLRRLVILDDAGQIGRCAGPGWEVLTTKTRFPSLPSKYQAIVDYLEDWPDAYAWWDDDDIYFRWHLTAVADGLTAAPWYYPEAVWTDQGGDTLARETPAGNLIACHAERAETWRALGGLPDTTRADFDLQHLSRLKSIGPPSRGLHQLGPSYVFRWGATGHTHYQYHAHNPAADAYASASALSDSRPCPELRPGFDPYTHRLLSRLDHRYRA